MSGVTEQAALLASTLQRLSALERAVSRTPSSATVAQTGDIKTTIALTAEPGWLILNGSSVANCDVAFPALWAIAPAGWKSGSTLNLPDMSNRVLMGGATVGDLEGSNSHALTVAQLPEHDHTINHGHADNFTTANDTHKHTGTTTNDTHNHTMATDQHRHQAAAPNGGTDIMFRSSVASGNFTVTGGSNLGAQFVYGGSRWTNYDTHSHTIYNDTHNHSLNVNDDTHNHTINGSVTAHSGSSGKTGSGNSVDHTPAHLNVQMMIKV